MRTKRPMRKCILVLLATILIPGALLPLSSWAGAQTESAVKQKVIIDTDIGDDIDDAFAVALALNSPELNILQINSDFGNTPLRARLLERFLHSVHREDIPVAVGVQTGSPIELTQRRYAEQYPSDKIPSRDAVEATLDLIRQNPGEITLIGIGPYVNIGAMIDRAPETFRKLKRIVIMGGSLNVGYLNGSDADYLHPPAAQPEWNVVRDIAGARKLFASGVPIYMMPLDSTQLKLDEVKRQLLFRHDSAIMDQLVLLYYQWGQLTPTLYDPMAVGFAIYPDLCPVTPMRIRVDDRGYTRQEPGEPNANVCMHSDPGKFFNFLMPRLLEP